MLTLPIDGTTLKRTFFEGAGNFELSTDQDVWKTLYDSGKPFTKDIQNLAQLKLGLGNNFQFGQAEASGLKLSVSASGEIIGTIKLIWPGSDDPLIATYQLADLLVPGRLYAAIILSAKADASFKGSASPAAGLTVGFGAGAGGHVGYDRLVSFSAAQSAREVVNGLFAGIRLPQSVDTVAEIAEPGEVVAFRYGGYLNLSASVAWGYSLTGKRDFKVASLDLELDYAVRLAASASFDYRLAGEFSIEHQCGKKANWARYVVRKSRESTLQFAADFGFEAEANLGGLPDTPDKLLAALLGADAKSILGVLAKVEENSTLEGLEKTVGKFAKQFIFDRADEWIGKALNQATIAEFLGVAQKVIEEYQNIDDRIIHLYEDFLDKNVPELKASLDLLLGVGSRDELQQLTDAPAWDLIRRLWNEKFHDLLVDDAEFQEFSAFVKRLKDFLDGGADKLVRDFIAEVKKAFPLDGLLNDLAKFDTPAKLQALADEKLQAFVGRLIGRAFSELKGKDFELVLKQIKAVTDKIGQFRTAYKNAIKKAAHQSFAFHLNYLYKRATKGEALLDIEIDLSKEGGPALAKLAKEGNFAGALRKYNPQLVRINKGKFTHELTRSAQVGISVFNWNRKGIVELVQNSEHSVETVEGGLMHVYSIDTSMSQTTETTDWHGFKEKVRSNFLLSIVGQAPQPTGAPEAAIDDDDDFLIDSLRSVAVKYDLLFDDERTKPAELTQYLKLAQYLGLVPSAADAVSEYQQQFPAGLGKVTVTYVVSYDDKAVRNGLSGTGLNDLEGFARQTARQLIAAKFTGMREKDWQARVGFAYLDELNESETSLYHTYHKLGNVVAFKQLAVTVALPAWFAKQGPPSVTLRPDDLGLLAQIYDVEDRFVKRLLTLSKLVKSAGDSKVAEDDLEKAARDFVDMADDLDKIGDTNTFFAAFDRLARQGVAAGGKRASAMVLEITPAGKDKVTKYLMA